MAGHRNTGHMMIAAYMYRKEKVTMSVYEIVPSCSEDDVHRE